VNLQILLTFFIIRSDNFTSKIFSTETSTAGCEKKTDELKKAEMAKPTMWMCK